MNKKFLSAILFGALMVTSTGTFVSCKDYDDDIENLQGQISANASAIAELKALIGDGNYVTSISVNGQNLVVNTKNGSQTVALPACEGGSLAEVKDGELYIDGKATGIKIDAGEAVKIENGEWAILQTDGTYKSTGIPASGVTAVKNDKGQWVLTVYNAEGEKESIILPTAASLITEVEMKGYLYATAYKKYIYNENIPSYVYSPISYDYQNYALDYNFAIVADGKNGSLNDDQAAWNAESMTKKLTPGQALSTIASYDSYFLVRIAPATVDASELDFSFVNSQMGGVDFELGTPVAYKGLLAESRATHENGLWRIPVTAKEGIVYEDEADYMSQFQVKNEAAGVSGYGNNNYADIYFALKEKEGFVSDFDKKFVRSEYISLDADAKDVSATLNKTAAVGFTNARGVYDAHIHFADADVLRWGIQYSGNGVQFVVTKLNDEWSIDGFDATVHFVTMEGEVKEQTIHVTVMKNTYTTVYDSNNIKLSSNNNLNNFTVSLSNMFNTLGEDASVLWKNDVYRVDIKYYRVKEGNEMVDQIVSSSDLSVDFLDANGAVVTGTDGTLGKAVTAKVNVNHEAALDRTKKYYALIRFYRNTDSSLINTIKVPFTISIPTLAELMKKEQVVFGGTSDGIGVLNEYDYLLSTDAVQYSLKYAFNNLANVFDVVDFSFAVDATQETKDASGTTLKMADLVTINSANGENARIWLKDEVNAYNKAINIQISAGATYLTHYAYTAEERADAAFTIKIVSPIEQGTLTAKNGESAVIEVVATEDGTAKLKESDLVAKTYAGIAYNVFMTKGTAAGAAVAYSSPYLEPIAVKFKSTNTNVFTVDEDGTPATIKADGTITAEGYTTITPMNVAYTDAVPVKITVTDVWGYTKEVEISVKVKPSTAG